MKKKPEMIKAKLTKRYIEMLAVKGGIALDDGTGIDNGINIWCLNHGISIDITRTSFDADSLLELRSMLVEDGYDVDLWFSF